MAMTFDPCSLESFSITAGDADGIIVSGPKQYMIDRGNALLESITAGNDVVCNYAWQQGDNTLMPILVSLQTDFAAWLGVQRDRAMFHSNERGLS